MDNIEKTISQFISSQFPQLYLEEGPELVEFVRTYYEFLETENQSIYDSRRLSEYSDIDLTLDKFLVFFQNKYMKGLPRSVVSNPREFQKHILDVYRSKGSITGLKLLFRILYDEDIDVYIPSYDIFKASDGIWIEERYVEVSSSSLLNNFPGKRIIGFNTNATAFVERIEIRKYNGKNVYILFLKDIQGQFIQNELIYYEGAELLLCPNILGSPSTIDVTNVAFNYQLGDIVKTVNSSGVELEAIVSDFIVGRGVIRFDIEDGGSGYSINAVVTITAGSNTSGSGAEFIVSEINPTGTFTFDTTIIEPYSNVVLNSSTFAFSNTDTSRLGSANLDSLIVDGLTFDSIEIGSISKIRVLNPGINYDGNVNVDVTDPITGKLNIPDGSGGFLGKNAIITGTAIVGDVVSQLLVRNSGFGYNDLENITLEPVSGQSNGSVIEGILNLTGVGTSRGFWKNTQGFLNSDKYLQDSFYYQEYSYEIKSSRSIDRYIDVLKQIFHPVGNEVFGRGVIVSEGQFIPTLKFSDINELGRLFDLNLSVTSDEIITTSIDKSNIIQVDGTDETQINTNKSLVSSTIFSDSGSILIQDYVSGDYFAEDYTGESRTF